MTARIHLLSGFRLITQHGIDATPRGAKARAIIVMLALEPGGRLPRRVVAEMLWSPPSDPLGNLRQQLSALGAHLSSFGLDVLGADRSFVWIARDRLGVDLLDLERWAHGEALPDPTALAAVECAEILGGLTAVEPAFEEWLEDHRAEVRRAAQIALTRLLARAREAGDIELAEVAAHRVLQVDPAAEEAYRALMEVAQARRDKGAVVAHYEACVEAMRRLIDVDVDPDTEALMRSIRESWSALQPRPPPILAPNSQLDMQPGGGTSSRGPGISPAHPDGEPVLLRINLLDGLAGSGIEARVGRVIIDAVAEALAGAGWLFRVVDDPLCVQSVDYELLGSSRPVGGSTRIALRLLRSMTRTLVWARHFDAPHDSPFDGIDAMAATVAAALEREIFVSEIVQSWSEPPEQLDCRRRMMLAIPLIFRLTPAALEQADRLLQSAAATLPADATPLAWRAFVGFLKLGQGWADDPIAQREELCSLVRRALEIAPDNVLAIAVAGHVSAFVEHRYALALEHFDRAQRANPNSAYVWALSALTYCYIGDTRQANRRLSEFRRLWPIDPYPHFFDTARCIAAAMGGNYKVAAELAKRTIASNPNFQATYRPLISSLGHLGKREEAARYIAELRRREPSFSIEWFRANYPPLNSAVHENYVAGFVKAGVPNC